MRTNYDDIIKFHQKFGLLPDTSNPSLIADKELYDFRVKFLKEELQEFIEAHDAGDLEKAADSLIDLAYVVLGTAYHMALPWQELWDEVHAKNMLKQIASSADESKRGYTKDIIKPHGWTPPDIKSVLDRFTF